MSAWSESLNASAPLLHGLEGELVSLRVSVAPRDLEEVLELLATLPFPVNPEIRHATSRMHLTVVEFPAYRDWVAEVRRILRQGGFPDTCVEVRSPLEPVS